MNEVGALGAVALLHIAALLSPGPNVLIVAQAAAGRSRAAGVSAAFGIATGAAIWVSIAAIGLAVLFQRFAWTAVAVKLLGGTYLVILGIRLLRRSGRGRPGAVAHQGSDGSFYWRGLASNLSNAQSAVFFASIFSVLLAPAMPVWVFAAGTVIIVVNSLAFHALLAWAFSAARVRQAYGRRAHWLDRGAGAIMILFGGRLLLLR